MKTDGRRSSLGRGGVMWSTDGLASGPVVVFGVLEYKQVQRPCIARR